MILHNPHECNNSPKITNITEAAESVYLMPGTINNAK